MNTRNVCASKLTRDERPAEINRCDGEVQNETSGAGDLRQTIHFHGYETTAPRTFGGGDELPTGTFRGGDEIPPGTFRGGDEIPAGTFRGGDEIPPGTFRQR